MAGVKQRLIAVYEKLYEVKMHWEDYRTRKQIGTPNILTIDETIDYLAEKKCSVSRFGDGELKIACGNRIRFQDHDPELSARLREILRSKDENCLVCLTDTFENIHWMVPLAYRYTWRIFYQYRRQWTELLDLNKQYGNAFMSRFYIDRKDKSDSGRLFQKLKTLWDGEKIVFIEGEQSRLGYHNDLFSNAASVERILCPAQDAFSSYNEILNRASELEKDKLILIALGPAATVLAYDLSRMGYRALDIGHVDIEYEWYLRGATEKIKIEDKYTSEAKGGSAVNTHADDEFQRQVIGHIHSKKEGPGSV